MIRDLKPKTKAIRMPTTCNLKGTKDHLLKNGFTLVEIMIVVAIVGLLVAMGMPSISKARQRTAVVNMEKNASLVAQSIAFYALKNELEDTATLNQSDIAPYLKGGWDGLMVGNSEATFPDGKQVVYWESDTAIIAKDLYGASYPDN